MEESVRRRQTRADGAFVVCDGIVVAGRDPILVLAQLASGELDLLKPCELPDGEYHTNADDGVTRQYR
jgi:hypothetical protein